MNIVLIIAGGVGSRMQQDVPKQFLTVNNKPIIIYTMEAFQNHKDIDAIAVVCLRGWEKTLKAYAKQYNITKLKWIIPGGKTGQDSTKNGLDKLNKCCKSDDLVLIHDGNRPLVSQQIITDSIKACIEKGFVVAGFSCRETVLISEDGKTADGWIKRETVIRTQTPITDKLKNLVSAYDEAKKLGIENMSSASNLMIELGRTVHISAGSEKNFKLTTIEDVDIFSSIINNKPNDGLNR